MDELSYFPYVLYYVHRMTLMESLTCCTRFQSFHLVKLHVSPAIHQTATDITFGCIYVHNLAFMYHAVTM